MDRTIAHHNFFPVDTTPVVTTSSKVLTHLVAHLFFLVTPLKYHPHYCNGKPTTEGSGLPSRPRPADSPPCGRVPARFTPESGYEVFISTRFDHHGWSIGLVRGALLCVCRLRTRNARAEEGHSDVRPT